MPRTSPSAAVVLGPYLSSQVDAITRTDPLVRVGDADGIHDMRVAARRLKAVLVAYRAAFDRATARHLCGELDWLAEILGHARDHEVQRLILLDIASGEREAAQVDAADRALAVEAQAALSAALVSARYRVLTEDLRALAASPPWTARAHRNAHKVLVSSLSRQFARVEARVESVKSAAPGAIDHRLHRVRKSVKRARYAAEASAPILNSKATTLAHRLSKAQDTLGAHNDLVVTRANSATWASLGVSSVHDRTLSDLEARARKSRTQAKRALGSVRHIAEAGRALV